MFSGRYGRISIAVAFFIGVLLVAGWFFFGGRLGEKTDFSVEPDNCYEETLVVAADAYYRPYVFFDGNGKLTGHDVEWIACIANRLRMNLELRPMTWAESLEAVRTGQVDAVLTCEIGSDPAYPEDMLLSFPLRSSDFVIFGKKRIDYVDALYGKRVALMEKGNVNPFLYQMGLREFCTEYPSNRSAFEAVADDECDYAVARYIIGAGILDDMGERGRDITAYAVAGPSNTCIGVGGGNVDLKRRIDEATNALKADGTARLLADKWLKTFVKPRTAQEMMQEYVREICFFLVIVIVAVVAYGWNKEQSLREQEEKVQYLQAELKMQEELKKAKEELEIASKAKTDFLFNMSHDIRTPMNAITGFTSMAKKYIDDRERVADYLQKIDVSGKQLLTFINQVLEMSRIESGKVRLEEVPVDIEEKFGATVNIFTAQAGMKGLQFNASLQDIVHRRVLADEAKVGQIIVNIVGNALKYTPEGGKIDFSLREVASPDAGRASFVWTVADTGIGMSEEYQKVLYEPFSRENNSTATRIQGTGLGMSIVKNLIGLLGGVIALKSEPGKGTRFDVTLDFAIDEAAAPKVEPEELSEVSFAGKRVLLVEDNELNREIAKDILEEYGLVVEEAEDGDVAVEKVNAAVERGEYDYYSLVLMDIQMPRLNGHEATKAIRAIPFPPGVHLPIVAMTANAFEEDRRNAIAAGMDDHLGKPIDLAKLMEVLSRFLR